MTTAQTSPNAQPSSPELFFHGEMLNDIEKLRIATENRLRSALMEMEQLPARDATALVAAVLKGNTNGVPASCLVGAGQLQALAAIEHQSQLALQRSVRKHPLGPWIKSLKGVGEKQAGRLLAAVNVPHWNYAEDRPRRGPAEFWAYCGYVPGQRRQKGVKSNWNAQAKMRAYLVAESAIKHRCDACREAAADREDGKWIPPPATCTCATEFPLRATYDAARLNWTGREGVIDGHAHNHALRLVAKELLKRMFLESRSAANE